MKKNHWVLLGLMLFLVLSWIAPVHGAWAPAGLSGQEVLSLVEDPTTTTTWYAGTANGGVYKDTGTSGVWVLSNTGLPAGQGIRALAMDNANPNTVYAGLNGGGIYKTVNGGSNWSPIGLDGLFVRDIAVDPYNSAILFAATNNGIYKTTDWGGSWQILTSTVFASADIRKIVLPSANPALNPLPMQTDTVYVATGDGLYESIDGGATWNRLVLASQSINSIAIDPQQPNTLYAGTSDAGIFKSSDGGNAWTQINNGLGSLNVLSIAINQKNPNSLVAGTADGGIFRSDWWGDGWYVFNEGNSSQKANVVKFLLPQPTSILAGSIDGILSFDNSGPDLIVPSVSGSTTVDTDTDSSPQVTVTVKVKNIGDGNTWNPHYAKVYLSTDATITTGDTEIGGYWINALAPGAE
ncbi:MAG: hypothetical protein HYS23_14815, partial [Geobacter sp.]|nr:hypothetical protein [Geobacter sp.]